MKNYSHEILKYSIDDNSLVINTYVENNTDTDLTAASILAVYNSSGTLKAIGKEKISAKKYDSTTADFIINDYSFADGDYIKLFLMTDTSSFSSICETKNETLIAKLNEE